MTLPAPTHRYQLDGSAWAGEGCMGAAAAMALDAYTRGAIRASMHDIRKNQDDKKAGIGLDDVATAWRRGWRLTFSYSFSSSWASVVKRWEAGDGAVITVNYGALGSWRAPGSRFTGAHALYGQRLVSMSGGRRGVVVNDPLRRSSVVIPEDALRKAYTGGAGWGKGTYAGGAASSPGVPAGAGGRTMADYLGVSPAATFDAAMLDRFLAKVREDTGNAGLYGAGFLRTYYSTHLGKPAGEVVYIHDPVTGAPGGDGGAVLGGILATALGDAIPRAAVLLGLVVLALIGVALTFRESSVVAIPSPVARLTRG